MIYSIIYVIIKRCTRVKRFIKWVKYMKDDTQYQKDLKFIEKIDSLTSKNIEFFAYFIGLASCFAVHILYFTMFAVNGIREMAYFNIFSILFYAVCILLIRKVKVKITIVYAAIAEIIIHASLATICVGWGPDFGMFLLMIIPITFLMPNKQKNIPFIFMFSSLLLYGVLRYIYNDPNSSVYDLEHTKIGLIFYVINIFIGTFVLVYATTIYTIMDRYTECMLRVQNEQLRIMALVDPLTRLSNRRAMGENLKLVSSGSQQSGKKYVIGLGDIDNFKKINDTYGHDYGDTVLSEVALILTEKIPENGYAARWGGEEFLFVIPESEVMDGFECAESIISSVRSHRFVKGKTEFFVTMTFGVCEGCPDDDVDKIISCADKRLYKGKNNGKNHTEYTD